MTAITSPTPSLPTDAPRLCSSCGAASAADASRCESCGGDRFAPPWVRELRKVDRSFAVQVNDPHEKSESDEPSLTFYKWWMSGRSSFHIRNQAQWERVKEIVDTELLASLGWASKEEIVAALAARGEEANGFDAKAILAKNPRLLLDIAEALQEGALGEQDPAAINESRQRIAAVAAKAEAAQWAAFRRSLEKVSQSKTTGPRQLIELTDELGLGERHVAAAELRRRAGLLELFTERLHDERSYKIVKYRCSIHRLLEQAIWIVDECCWPGEEGKALRVALDRAAVERDRPYAKKPPDFACAVHEGRLLVVSVQPPSRELGVADLDLLERHVAACRELEPFAAFEATLVGAQVSEELRGTLDLREDSFKVKTYAQLVDEPLQRYRTRLEAPSAS